MDPEEQTRHEEEKSNSNAKTDDGDTQSIGVSSGVTSISISNSQEYSSDGDALEEHRNMMLASLLEDYIRTRAAEFLNSTDPSKTYTRQSPEIQPLARQLFAEASRTLSANGVLSGYAASDDVGGSRRRYLSALDNLVAGTRGPAAQLQNSMHDLISKTSRLALMPHPANDIGLTLQRPQAPSHYQSSFRELSLLGKGGFGKVYRCFNPLDRGTYAVKKIQISPRLGRTFRDGRLEELQHILREVQALATLDHPNIVRYHATWLEEPQRPLQTKDTHDSSKRTHTVQRPQLLLEHHPFSEDVGGGSGSSLSDGIVFAEDTTSFHNSEVGMQLIDERQWSEEPSSSREAATDTSDIFTDGKSHPRETSQIQDELEASGHTLYIQMSLYPMTLAQYISQSSNKHDTLKHCFHLLPSLRLLRGIHAGLRYMHTKGFIHRDIKPGNIFLSSPETAFRGGYCNLACDSCPKDIYNTTPRWLNPRIGDFGLVALLAHGEFPSPHGSVDSTATSGVPIGTAYYRPPSSKDADNEKVDIFALGVVFIEMLCPCDTAMERVDMLKRLQTGYVPIALEEGLQSEGHPREVIEDAVALAKAMVDPNSKTRWSSPQVDDAVENILRKCEKL